MSITKRPSTMAEAFVNAAVKQKNVDTQRGTGNWIARRVILNTERINFAIVCEMPKKDKQ